MNLDDDKPAYFPLKSVSLDEFRKDYPSMDDEDTVDELPAPPRKDIPVADLELLELAARALGARFEEVDGEGYGNLYFADGSVVYGWNSLLFGGDTLDLSVRLGIVIRPFPNHHQGSQAVASVPPYFEEREYAADNSGDLAAATRRAVTRAAAEIGRVMLGNPT